MKKIIKNILVAILGWQVRRLRNKNNFKIIGVVGSIGKTSTKLAIAKMLEGQRKTRYQEGNYNDIVSVPLVIFGHEMPQLWNIFSWIKIIFQNELQIFGKFPFEFLVLELGTDKPGDIPEFRKYLHLDIAVITAVTPEHMEFFETIEKVAEEEWNVNFWSDIVFANKDLCQFIPETVDHKKIVFYGKDFGSLYKIENIQKNNDGFNFEISFKGGKVAELSLRALSEVEIYSTCASLALAKYLMLSIEGAKAALEKNQAFSGRMQKLKGIKNSTIIDDTYNASPESMKIAISALYAQEANQRIAILGMMNELGKTSKIEHEKVGKLCDPKLLDLVVTIGKGANEYLAKVAEENGCNVYRSKNAKEAGDFVKDKIKEGAVILAKGSQNGVFAEEALKPLLANPSDSSRLVRQSAEWIEKKAQN